MCIPVRSPWLPGHIDVAQTIFIILTMAGPFPDRPHFILWWSHTYNGAEKFLLSVVAFVMYYVFVQMPLQTNLQVIAKCSTTHN